MILRALPLVLVATLALAGCGSSNSSSSNGSNAGAPAQTVHFAKTKFVIHAGLAFGVFHHFIYNPYKAGKLNHPLLHKLAFIKAAAAALVVIHETKLALADAQHSKLLSKVVAPLAALGGAVTLVRSALLHGKVNSGSMDFANSSTSQASSAASAAGQPVTESTAGAGL